MIDNLEELAELIQQRVTGVQGPAYSDHGYVASRTMSYWLGVRRVHFYFEKIQGALAICVEAAEAGPKRRVRTGHLWNEQDAWKIVDRFLLRGKHWDELPDLDWQEGGAHDDLVPHPPDQPRPDVSVGLVGKIEKKEPAPRSLPGARGDATVGGGGPPEQETQRTKIVTRILSRAGGVEALAGLTLYSKEPDKLAAWYREKLGVETARHGDNFAGRIGPASFAIYGSEATQPGGVRLLMTFRVGDFDAFVEALAVKGIEIEALDATQNGKYAYIHDPEGNPIELWGGAG